ncbi:hypothetical protein FXN63_13785 [Pigmentiphaga aceris]|uniref:HTH domain-containing protein n=1 Tax=Pigmentiphaga aceris TaxID=1940612 RepID=A0A5C0AYW6_9BURK|nr:tetratricopeptide repeat protein [Pigmentiphaga aceris]QEI06784.1 hypothetical protein FXN63_13785 [Pigmentiphaga aceris]
MASTPPVLWPSWLSEDIAGLGIWLVGYPAPKTNWGGIALTLADRADNILARLLSEPLLAKGNVIFVVHSLGGLIVEQLLRGAERDAASNRKAEHFLSRVRRIAFLGTPHRGAILANIAMTLRVFFLRPSAATRDLLLGSPQLKDLNRWYRKKSQANGIEHLVLAEGRPERVFGINLPETLGRVVWSDSADPGLPELSITVDESHTTICKPASREADVYIHVKDFIARSFIWPSKAPIVEAVENNTSQLKQLIIQSQEQTLALEAFERTLEKRPLVLAMDTAIIDAEVIHQTERLRKCRFFGSVDTVDEARRLVISLTSGALAAASSSSKSDALAWCARFLATAAPDEAQFALNQITTPNRELIAVVRSFLKQGGGSLAEGLGELAAIDTPIARGAAYICVQKDKGFEEAEIWLCQAGLTKSDLDSDAKFFHIGAALEAGAWDIACEAATALSNVDFDRTPAILRLAADAHLSQAVPDELRLLPRQYLPSNAASFPLRSEPDRLRDRRKAIELYDQLTVVATALGLPLHAGDSSDRALWLRLRDPEYAAAARRELETSLRDPAVLLRRLNLAVQFGIEIDLSQVEKEVDRQTVLSGGASPDAAVARFSLALVQGGYASTASYLNKHRAQLLDHIEWKGVYLLEIEALARSGQFAQAEILLREAVEKGLAPNEENRLSLLLREIAGNDPIVGRLAAYENSRSVVDLRLLVDAYENAGNWEKVVEYGKHLLAKTGDISDAHRYVVALYNQEHLEEVLTVFSEYENLDAQYDNARLLYARTLFEQGNIKKAQLVLNTLRKNSDSTGARQLQVSLTIASGDWDSLQGFVEGEWSNRLERTPEELLSAGQIAQLIGAVRGKDLVCDAAARADGDAKTLIGCYHAAVSAGWEESREVFQWFEQSAVLSEQAGDGLIQRLSIEDIVERKPAWDERETNARNLLTRGEIPQFTFGKILNRSLLNVFLWSALVNVDEQDVRQRSIVHAFSGARKSSVVDPQTIAIDPTSLMTAELLGVFDIYVSTFDKILIPHNTLGWLLNEKAQILFHQPSRVAAARALRRMISDQHLLAFDGDSYAPDNLISEVGDSLALLLAEASDPNHSDQRQRLVVRGGPIHRVSTFMKEEADLTDYMPYLCSAVDLVEKLAQKAVLTVSEAHDARESLKLRETPWPPKFIADGAILYLDDITISHLEFLGLLQKLHRADITVVIPQSEIDEADALISHDASSAAVVNIVDGLRIKLKNALESGRVGLGKAIRVDDDDDASGALVHPSTAMLKLIDSAEAGVSDDRFINQHLFISSGVSTKPLLTTLDLLDSLERRGVLSSARILEAKTALRRANYAILPISHRELSEFVSSAPIVDGDLVETAELRLIRESVQRIRMCDLLQLPKEATWLNDLLSVSVLVLKEQWVDDLNEVAACARSDWILILCDARGWTHRLNEEAQRLKDRYLDWVALLMMLVVDQTQSVKEAYWRWFVSRILNKIADEDQEMYALLLERAKEVVAQYVELSVERLGARNGS